MKTKFVISKKWHGPEFTYKFTDVDVSAEVLLVDFVKILKAELKASFLLAVKNNIGSVTWTFKKATFEKQLDDAMESVFDKEVDEAIIRALSGIKTSIVDAI